MSPENKHDPELYTWDKNPEETILHDTLHHASQTNGQVRSWGTETLLIEGTNLREVFPAIPEGATHLRMQSEERFDNCIYAKHIKEADLTVSLIERDKYPDGSETEPIRLGVGVSNEEGSLFADYIVPSRHREFMMLTWGHFPATAEENRPPHVKLTTSEGVDLKRLFMSANLVLSASEADPGSKINAEQRAIFAECLARFESLISIIGISVGEAELSEKAMRALDEWANLYFFDDPKSQARLRKEETAQAKKLKETVLAESDHVRIVMVNKPGVVKRFMGGLVIKRKR